MNVLILSHAHPDFSVGGAEIAAYNLFNSIGNVNSTGRVVFLARTDLVSVPSGMIRFYKKNEYLWRQEIGDWFRLRSGHPESILDEFTSFLEDLKPDVVFIQHYAHIGVDVISHIRRVIPDCAILLTLHEYLAICHRNGQFVKNGTKRLCYEESIDACAVCFPEFSNGDFWLRKDYIISNMSSVDMFVSPSTFLAERYISWGLGRSKFIVIENGQSLSYSNKVIGTKDNNLRVGFFGQINEYKGVDILLQAVTLLPDGIRARLTVEIHGANLETQGQWFRELIERLRQPLLEHGCLQWIGPYEPREVRRRMAGVDCVVVPSIWWENSPMVIQEAFVYGKPVICSNIGGMAEKVRDEIDGLHFEVRNPRDLATTLARLVNEDELVSRLSSNIRSPLSYDECALAYWGAAMDVISRRRE